MYTGIEYLAVGMPILIVLIVFVFIYLQTKSRHQALIEISKNIQDPAELKNIIRSLDEKQKPLNKKSSGVVLLFVGIGLYGLGHYFLGDILKGVGVLVLAIGAGTFIAGHFFPDKKMEH